MLILLAWSGGCGTAAQETPVEDVATPASYAGDMEVCDIYACSNSGPDGYDDLTLKFKYKNIVAALGDKVNHGDCLMLELTGYLMDGTFFSGKDVVRIKKKKSK